MVTAIPHQWSVHHCSPSLWTWKQEVELWKVRPFLEVPQTPCPIFVSNSSTWWVKPAFIISPSAFSPWKFPMSFKTIGNHVARYHINLSTSCTAPFCCHLLSLSLPYIISHSMSSHSSSSPFLYIFPSILAITSCKSLTGRRLKNGKREKGNYTYDFFPIFLHEQVTSALHLFPLLRDLPIPLIINGILKVFGSCCEGVWMQHRVEVECFDKGFSEKTIRKDEVKSLFVWDRRKENHWCREVMVRANQHENVLIIILNTIFAEYHTWYSSTCLAKAPL